jgi:peptidoglycan/LPS O-acetylase OafA/YrhL
VVGGAGAAADETEDGHGPGHAGSPFHLNVGVWVFFVISGFVLFVTALPLVVLAATASWYIVERPSQRASRRLTRSGQLVASAGASADAADAAPGSNR